MPKNVQIESVRVKTEDILKQLQAEKASAKEVTRQLDLEKAFNAVIEFYKKIQAARAVLPKVSPSDVEFSDVLIGELVEDLLFLKTELSIIFPAASATSINLILDDLISEIELPPGVVGGVKLPTGPISPAFSIEQAYGQERPVFTAFLKNVRDSAEIKKSLGENFPFFKTFDSALGIWVDIDPKKAEADEAMAKELATQINLVCLCLLEEELSSKRTGIYPSQDWFFDSHPFMTLTTGHQSSSRKFKDLVTEFPEEIQPYFNDFNRRMLTLSVFHKLAFNLNNLLESKQAKYSYQDVINYVNNPNAKNVGFRGVDIEGLFEKHYSQDAPEILRDEVDDSWILGDLFAMARYELRKSVRGQNGSAPSKFPVSKGDIPETQGKIKELLIERFEQWRGGKLDKSDEFLVDVAVKQAMIYFRATLEEMAADPKAFDSEFSRGARLREYFSRKGLSKTATDPTRAYKYGPDTARVAANWAPTLDETTNVSIELGPGDFEEVDLKTYFQQLIKRYPKPEDYEKSEEFNESLGYFYYAINSNEGGFDQSWNAEYSEMKKRVRAFRITRKAQIFGKSDPAPATPVDSHQDIILVPSSRIMVIDAKPSTVQEREYINKATLPNFDGTETIQLHITYEQMYAMQVESSRVIWDTVTSGPREKYDKIISSLQTWFVNLCQMDKEHLDKVFKDIDDIKPPVVRKRGLKQGFRLMGMDFRTWVAAREEDFRSRKGVFLSGGKPDAAYAIDEQLSSLVEMLDYKINDTADFGLNNFFQYACDYFFDSVQPANGSFQILDRNASGVVEKDKKGKDKKKKVPVRDLSFLLKIFRDPRIGVEGLVATPALVKAIDEWENSPEKSNGETAAKLKVVFELLFLAFCLYLNRYQYNEFKQEFPTMGSTELPTTISGQPNLTFERRMALMQLFIKFQSAAASRVINDRVLGNEFKDSDVEQMIAANSFRDKKGDKVDLNLSGVFFGAEEMKAEMVRQGLVGTPQQAIADLRKAKEIMGKLPSSLDYHVSITSEKAPKK